MTRDELRNNLNLIDKEYQSKRMIAFQTYANDNNPYKAGDVITDHNTSIEIKKIDVCVSLGESECVYSGTQVDKKGVPKKNQISTIIYQSNIIK